MAAFTSAASGDWNDGATWGNASPGAKGVDWPGNAGDTATILNTHVVDYNVDEANELGDVTINNGGTFRPKAGADRRIRFGDTDLIANGTLGNGVFAAANKFYIEFNTTGDNANGIIIGATGVVNLQDDPAYYGSMDYTTLNGDGTGVVNIPVNDVVNIDWNIGDELLIHKFNTYANYNTDWLLTSIAGFAAGSTITCADVVSNAFKDGARVYNLTRNVQITKVGATTAIGTFNANRPKITNAGGTVNLSALMTGMRTYLDTTYSGGTLGGVYRNGAYVRNYSGTISAHLVSISAVAVSSQLSGLVTGDIMACQRAFNGCGNVRMEGDVLGCGDAFYLGAGNTLAGQVFSCNTANDRDHLWVAEAGSAVFYCVSAIRGIAHDLSMNLGSDTAGVARANTVDFVFSSDVVLRNSKLPASPVFTNRNVTGYTGRIRSEHDGQVLGARQIYDCFGTLVDVDADGTGDNPNQRTDGDSIVVEVTPQSNICPGCQRLKLIEMGDYIFNGVSGTAYTFKMYVQSTYVTLPNTEIQLQAHYLDGVTGGSVTIATSNEAVTTRSNQSDWTQFLSVACTPAADGPIKITADIMGYEAGKKIWFDPIIEVS